MFSTKKTRKFLKILVYGKGGTGKTTFGTTMPSNRYWVDSEHSGDHIRPDGDAVLYTTSFKDLQDAVREVAGLNDGVGSLILDPCTIFRETLMDKVESETKGGLEFRHWAKIKKPEKRLTTDWQNLPCHVLITYHEKDEYEMIRNDKGKLEPVKIGVKIDGDKKSEYGPDIVMRLAVEKGVHVGFIDKIRINKAIALKTGLTVGTKIENPTFDTFKPILEEYSKGDKQATYTDDRQTSEKDDAVFDEIDKEQEEAEKKKIVGQVQRGEKKCLELKIYGWQDKDQVLSTRKTSLGTDALSDASVEDLNAYVQGIKQQVLTYKQQKVEENTNA